jgi:hypothetical protein
LNLAPENHQTTISSWGRIFLEEGITSLHIATTARGPKRQKLWRSKKKHHLHMEQKY